MNNASWPVRVRANVNLNVRAQPRLGAVIVEKVLRGSFLTAEAIENGDVVKGEARWYRAPAVGALPTRYFWAGGVVATQEPPVPSAGGSGSDPDFLTNHFSLQELIASQTASRRGIDNTPNAAIRHNLTRLASVLEEVRSLLGDVSIRISSGYRCAALNAAVGGSSGSLHMQGLAADFTAYSYGSVYKTALAISASEIQYEELIYEFRNWVHIGLPVEGAQASRRTRSIFVPGQYIKGIVER